MTDWMFASAGDYSDLNFDVERHKEAFRRFSDPNIGPGRCLDMGKSKAVAEDAGVVYLALFDPEVSDIQ